VTFGFARIDDGTLAVLTDERVVPLVDLVGDGRGSEPPRTFVDLLAHWDGWCDDVEHALALDTSAPSDPGRRTAASVDHLPPVVGPTVYCAGANYLDHIEEMTQHRPERGEGAPYHFVVPGGALTGHRSAVRTPDGCTQLDWEIELVVVIGRLAERVSEAAALEHVAGYTVANDISMRDFALRPDTPFGVDWLRSKAYNTCLPMGPSIVPARFVPDPQDLALRLWVGDELMQDSDTSEMLFGVAEQVAYLSAIVPLLPGDVICTGTPAGVGFARGRFLQPGDVVTAEIEGVGRLVNHIV
jgi:2-keto-4-pentenoate hydratase/2-oxohepta-3-ene-1,7-dioic acid hydratase in catechol pathway